MSIATQPALMAHQAATLNKTKDSSNLPGKSS